MTHIAELKGIDGIVRVSEYSVAAVPPGEKYGVTGTLYHGDQDLIADYLARPEGELDIYGVCHHITVSFDGTLFTLAIDFVGAFCQVSFDHMVAREMIFAMAGVLPYDTNPHRR